MQLFATWISGNNSEEFIVDYLKSTDYGKRIFAQENESGKFGQVINRINFIHSTCPKNHKSKIISLLSQAYTFKELSDLGFIISRKQHDSSKKYIDSNFSELFEKKPRVINESLKNTVKEYLIMNSSEARELNKKMNLYITYSCPKEKYTTN